VNNSSSSNPTRDPKNRIIDTSLNTSSSRSAPTPYR
jgi:hypothetical protein